MDGPESLGPAVPAELVIEAFESSKRRTASVCASLALSAVDGQSVAAVIAGMEMVGMYASVAVARAVEQGHSQADALAWELGRLHAESGLLSPGWDHGEQAGKALRAFGIAG